LPAPYIENTLNNYIPITVTESNLQEEVENLNNLMPVVPLWNEQDFEDLDVPSMQEVDESDDEQLQNVLNETSLNEEPLILCGLSRTLSNDDLQSPKRLKIIHNDRYYTEIEDTNAQW